MFGSSPDWSRGSRSSSRLILICAPEGLSSEASGSPEQDAEHPGRDVGEHVASGHGPGPTVVVPAHLGGLTVGSDPAHSGFGDHLRACRAGGAKQGVGDRAHAADRHSPLPVADEAIEEAPVLD